MLYFTTRLISCMDPIKYIFEKLALIGKILLEKHGLYLIQNIHSGKINGSTSFAIDNMYYVNFRI